MKIIDKTKRSLKKYLTRKPSDFIFTSLLIIFLFSQFLFPQYSFSLVSFTLGYHSQDVNDTAAHEVMDNVSEQYGEALSKSFKAMYDSGKQLKQRGGFGSWVLPVLLSALPWFIIGAIALLSLYIVRSLSYHAYKYYKKKKKKSDSA